MRIGRRRHQQKLNRNLAWLGLLLLVFSLGVILAERGLLQAVNGAFQARLPLNGRPSNDELPLLVVDMSFANFNTILTQREMAQATGVVTTSAVDFVPATIRWQGSEIPARLRLQPGTAAHLSDDEKWNFEVETRDNYLLLDVRRFYLLDPADNNWLYEWAFIQSLWREGILAPRYHFVRLVLNGDNQGIYAVQEGPGRELITSQSRPEGIIVEFDATRWWQILAYFGGEARAAIADPVTRLTADEFQYFEVRLADEAAITADEALATQSQTAIGLLRALQQGQLPAASVFDVTQYGRFLALVDLWGATGATSLANLRTYYNPTSDRLEPIAYSGNPLSAAVRVSSHSFYHDPAIQAAYVEAAARVSQPAYLQQLQADLDDQLRRLQSTLALEANLPLPWEALSKRQEQLRRSLNPLQPVFAYVSQPQVDIPPVIQIDVANALNLPVEVLGFDVGGVTFLEVKPEWIQGDAAALLIADEGGRIVLKGRDSSPALAYVRFHLPLTGIQQIDGELDYTQVIDVQVAARLWGRDTTQLTLSRPGSSAFPRPVGSEGNQ